ncbi:zinc finger, SWIM-type [Comamonas thiooxydans]|nr:zinc finger, SWIM-type [Comamonas thiooxydans]
MHVTQLLYVLIFCTFSSAQCHGDDRLTHCAQRFARSVKPQFLPR